MAVYKHSYAYLTLINFTAPLKTTMNSNTEPFGSIKERELLNYMTIRVKNEARYGKKGNH